MSHWGAIIYERREELGLTFKELAARAGVPVSTVKSMELPDANPCVNALEKVLNALRYDLEVVDADFGSPTPLAIVEPKTNVLHRN